MTSHFDTGEQHLGDGSCRGIGKKRARRPNGRRNKWLFWRCVGLFASGSRRRAQQLGKPVAVRESVFRMRDQRGFRQLAEILCGLR